MDGESKVQAIAFFITFGFDAKRLGTGQGRHLNTINNRPRTIYQYYNIDPRLSGHKRLGYKTSPNIEVCPESLGVVWCAPPGRIISLP